jgi:hypothetical protein
MGLSYQEDDYIDIIQCRSSMFLIGYKSLMEEMETSLVMLLVFFFVMAFKGIISFYMLEFARFTTTYFYVKMHSTMLGPIYR